MPLQPVRSPIPPPPVPAAPHALPGTPAVIPVEPRSGQIVFGLALVGLGLWLLVDWLPSHRPLNPGEALVYVAKGLKQGVDRTGHWMFNAKLYPWTLVLAGLVALLGTSQVIRGATYRAYKEVICHQCKTRVLAKKGSGGALQCPLGPHPATRGSYAGFLLLVLFTLILVIVLASR